MQVRWSPSAFKDLEGIVDHINNINIENADAAQRVAQTIYDRASELGSFRTKADADALQQPVNYRYRLCRSLWSTEFLKMLMPEGSYSQRVAPVNRIGATTLPRLFDVLVERR